MPAASVGGPRRRKTKTTSMTKRMVTHKRELQRGHAGANGLRAIRQDVDVDPRGNPALQLRQKRIDRSTVSMTLALACLVMNKQNRRLAVERRRRAWYCARPAGFGDGERRTWRRWRLRTIDWRNRLGLSKLTVGAKRCARSRLPIAERRQRIGVGNRVADILQETPIGQALRIRRVRESPAARRR